MKSEKSERERERAQKVHELQAKRVHESEKEEDRTRQK